MRLGQGPASDTPDGSAAAAHAENRTDEAAAFPRRRTVGRLAYVQIHLTKPWHLLALAVAAVPDMLPFMACVTGLLLVLAGVTSVADSARHSAYGSVGSHRDLMLASSVIC